MERLYDKCMDLELRPFSEIDIEDSFFDSLKEAYPEFSVWYAKKASHGEKAYVSCFEDGRVADCKVVMDFMNLYKYENAR